MWPAFSGPGEAVRHAMDLYEEHVGGLL